MNRKSIFRKISTTGFFLLLFLCLFVQKAKADTIDICRVYLNDSLVLNINQNEFATASLHLSSVQPTDSVRIEYWTDTGMRGNIYVVRTNENKLVQQTGFVPHNVSAFTIGDLPKEGCRVFFIRGSSRPEEHLFDIVFD